MAKVRTLVVGIETSIKLAEYQYIKPRIDITYRLDDGESPGKVMAEARNRLTVEMEKLEKHVRENGKSKDNSEIPF